MCNMKLITNYVSFFFLVPFLFFSKSTFFFCFFSLSLCVMFCHRSRPPPPPHRQHFVSLFFFNLKLFLHHPIFISHFNGVQMHSRTKRLYIRHFYLLQTVVGYFQFCYISIFCLKQTRFSFLFLQYNIF